MGKPHFDVNAWRARLDKLGAADFLPEGVPDDPPIMPGAPFLFERREALATPAGAADENTPTDASDIWLPFLNTYRTMCISPDADLRRSLEAVRAFGLAA